MNGTMKKKKEKEKRMDASSLSEELKETQNHASIQEMEGVDGAGASRPDAQQHEEEGFQIHFRLFSFPLYCGKKKTFGSHGKRKNE